MDYVTLGRTGLRVSVAGLGAGGASRLGQSTGRSEDESKALIRHTLEAGVNVVDTAEAYRNEEIVGAALDGWPRDQVVISTKTSSHRDDQPRDEAGIVASFEESLARLRTDYVDVYHLHGVREHQYGYARETLLPVLHRLRDQGKIRFVGITEAFGADPQHRMAAQAAKDGCWDVMMVGHNMLNQSARRRVFPHTIANGVGVLIMFAVRRVFSDPQRLGETLAELARQGRVDPAAVDPDDPLAFLVAGGGASSLPDAAYRFCRHEPGAHVVLFGTGDPGHADANIASLLRPPLPAHARQRLERIFADVDHLSGN